MNRHVKILNLVVLCGLFIFNCPLIFKFISIRGAVIIFHYWFIYGFMFLYNSYLFNVTFCDNYGEITKEFYEAIRNEQLYLLRKIIYVLYVSLYLTFIYVSVFSTDEYMTHFQKIVYLINFILGTIVSTTITKHDEFYELSQYKNFVFVDKAPTNIDCPQEIKI